LIVSIIDPFQRAAMAVSDKPDGAEGSVRHGSFSNVMANQLAPLAREAEFVEGYLSRRDSTSGLGLAHVLFVFDILLPKQERYRAALSRKVVSNQCDSSGSFGSMADFQPIAIGIFEKDRVVARPFVIPGAFDIPSARPDDDLSQPGRPRWDCPPRRRSGIHWQYAVMTP
jgi:hypothetical protein